jgi:magnesium-protoporphyrin O-methyltransferase
MMHVVGRAFPRGNRAPAIEPVAEQGLRRKFADHPDLADWRVGRSRRVTTGFYMSHALELMPS